MTESANFTDTVLAANPSAVAIIERARDGARREWSFAELQADVHQIAAQLTGLGLKRGDVVMTLIGNRPAWASTMLACFRQGFVVLPCNEQLRAKDLTLRLKAADVAAVVADPRNREALEAAGTECPIIWIDELEQSATEIPAPVVAGMQDPALMTFTSGTSGPPKCVVHAHRYLWGQKLQANHWMSVQPGDRVWCTAASGWSKSARNSFIAPWIRGATSLMHDGRFDVNERLQIVKDEQVTVLCMAPTEYRTIVNRGGAVPLPELRSCIAAGEALPPETLREWEEITGTVIRDGYGQTETGHLTYMPADVPARPGSMGIPLPGVKTWLDGDELVIDPSTVPTFFLGYHGEEPPPAGEWRTGDRVTLDDDGFLYFEGRADDVIVSAGYRIGPFEVESVLLEHPAVADVGVVGAPDADRGSIVRAVVVVQEGFEPSDELAKQLQDHVKAVTAPYKYPRKIDFIDSLPRTTSGKLRRNAIR